MPNNSEYAAIPAPVANLTSLHATVVALKQTVEVLVGQRGTGTQAAVTQADLTALQAQIAALTPTS